MESDEQNRILRVASACEKARDNGTSAQWHASKSIPPGRSFSACDGAQGVYRQLKMEVKISTMTPGKLRGYYHPPGLSSPRNGQRNMKRRQRLKQFDYGGPVCSLHRAVSDFALSAACSSVIPCAVAHHFDVSDNERVQVVVANVAVLLSNQPTPHEPNETTI
ncbi:hypothetical protein PABG_05997 [Paracoccidioides brasiliensis Pb03]|nr:hypothetical protein PABG_05997 [Paracoccidioides brasiliensis Pb03]